MPCGLTLSVLLKVSRLFHKENRRNTQKPTVWLTNSLNSSPTDLVLILLVISSFSAPTCLFESVFLKYILWKSFLSEEFRKSIASMLLLFNDNLNHDFKYWPTYALKSMCTTFYIDLSYFRNLYVGGLVVSQLRLILHMFCHYAIMKLAQKTKVNLINVLKISW